jgi:hypothetical protein
MNERRRIMTNPQSDTIVALRQTHRAWRKEIGEVLAPVRRPEAGVWERWSAARYLTGEFAPRLDREQQVLTTLGERLPAQQSGHVWALGELLEFLCGHLCELARMPQAGPAFADAVNKLVRAFEFWCAEVEVGVEAAGAAGGFAPDIARELAPRADGAMMAVPA